MSEDSELKTARISIDWARFRNFLFRLVTGVGLVIFWLLLFGIAVSVLIWAGIFIAKQPFAWTIGIAVTIPIILMVWYVSYWMALDSLSDIGIQLDGAWAWCILPIAPLVALISFFLVYLAGMGSWVTRPLLVAFAFGGGAIILLLIFLAAILR
jgi:hypothetical protein